MKKDNNKASLLGTLSIYQEISFIKILVANKGKCIPKILHIKNKSHHSLTLEPSEKTSK